MKTIIILFFFLAAASMKAEAQRDTTTLEIKIDIKDTQSSDYKSRKLFDLNIELDKKHITNPEFLNIWIYQKTQSQYYELYQNGFMADELSGKLKTKDEFKLKEGKYELELKDVAEGLYMIEIRLVGSDKIFYFLDREITVQP